MQDRICRTPRDGHSWTRREAEFRFYEELNDFLPPERRKTAFRRRFQGTPAVCDLIAHALEAGRIILTRDVGLLKHRRVTHGYWLRSDEPKRQFDEIIEALDLARQARPFSRCRECNGEIEALARESLGPEVDAAIRSRFERFWRCNDCRRVYWQGSHYQRLLRRVHEAVSDVIGEVGDACAS